MLNVTPETDGGSSKAIGQEDFPAPIGKLLGLRLSTPADGQAIVEFEATERAPRQSDGDASRWSAV